LFSYIYSTNRDSAGQDDYAKLRPLGYADADVFLLCYSIADRVTYKSIDLKVSHFSSNWEYLI
jgi:GTPase SAR1 family protein